MHEHLENLTHAQAYVAREGAKETGGVTTADDLVARFIRSIDNNTAFLVRAIVAKIGEKAFVKNSCQVEASEGTLDFFFEGFMEEAERIDFYQKYYGNIEEFLSDEADIEDINMIDRVEKARMYFPQEFGSDRPVPNDIDFSQGDMYELFLDNDTDHEHYAVVASSITCDVVDVIADKFTSFINRAIETADTIDSDANDASLNANFQEGYNNGYADGYDQAKKDVMAALSSN